MAGHQAGRSTKWPQRTYCLSQGAVLRLLDVAGVPRRRPGLTAKQIEEASRRCADGWSLTRIGDYFGKDHTVSKNAVIRVGIVLRPPSGHKLPGFKGGSKTVRRGLPHRRSG